MRTPLLIPLVVMVLLAGCTASRDDDAAGARPSGPPVLASVHAVSAGDNEVLLTWSFDVADGWHLYWPGLNDSGFPPSVILDMPQSFQAGALRWPVPTRKVLPGDILDHVLDMRRVEVQQVVTMGPSPTAGRDRLQARVRWLACKEACVPGDTTLVVMLPADLETGAAGDMEVVYPQDIPQESFSYHMNEETLVVTAPGAAALRFFPYEDCGPFVDLLKDGEGAGERLWLRLRPRDGGVGPVRGLLQIERPDGTLVTGPLVL